MIVRGNEYSGMSERSVTTAHEGTGLLHRPVRQVGLDESGPARLRGAALFVVGAMARSRGVYCTQSICTPLEKFEPVPHGLTPPGSRYQNW